jgi:hypothetical protein
MPIRFHAPPKNRLSMTMSAWNKLEPAKLIRPMNVMTTDALAHNTSTLRERGCGHTACMIKSSRARERHLSSLETARMLWQLP